MNPQALAEAYLGALGRADLAAMLIIFSDGALARSPLHGPMLVSDFYSAQSAIRQNRSSRFAGSCAQVRSAQAV